MPAGSSCSANRRSASRTSEIDALAIWASLARLAARTAARQAPSVATSSSEISRGSCRQASSGKGSEMPSAARIRPQLRSEGPLPGLDQRQHPDRDLGLLRHLLQGPAQRGSPAAQLLGQTRSAVASRSRRRSFLNSAEASPGDRSRQSPPSTTCSGRRAGWRPTCGWLGPA
jgi:hypothetical protein